MMGESLFGTSVSPFGFAVLPGVKLCGAKLKSSIHTIIAPPSYYFLASCSLELFPEINPWCCPGSGPPGTCRSLPLPSGPEIRDAFHILGPWGSSGIQRYPTLGVLVQRQQFPRGVVVVIYNKIKVLK